MSTRRLIGVGALTLSLLVPAGVAPLGAQARRATGFKGTVKRLPPSSMARRALAVMAINPNRATVIGTRHLDRKSQYKMILPAGLYMVGAEGLRSRVRFTHAKRLRRGQMVTVNLPPKRGPRPTPPRSATGGTIASPARAAGTGRPVVTVGPITVEGMAEFREGADLWYAFDLELEKGSRPRCKVDYTSDRILELVQQEIDFQQSHYVDPSTRITPNLVTPTSRVSGTITESNDVLTMSLTETDLETGDINQTESVTGPQESFIDLVERLARKVGRNLCPPQRVTGSITYSEATSYTSGPECCAEQEDLSAGLSVSMKALRGNVGYEDNGSDYSITYSRSSSGRQSGCNYAGSWSGSAAGPVTMGAGKLVEPGDISPITGQPAETRELLVSVERDLDYTQSGSETYSGCDNPNDNTTIPYPEAPASLEDVYGACESTSGYLEFKGGDQSSPTLTLSCSRTEGDTTYSFNGTLELGN